MDFELTEKTVELKMVVEDDNNDPNQMNQMLQMVVQRVPRNL